jgi:hypothetical protein
MSDWTPLLLIFAGAALVFVVLGVIADHLTDEQVDAFLRNKPWRPFR